VPQGGVSERKSEKWRWRSFIVERTERERRVHERECRQKSSRVRVVEDKFKVTRERGEWRRHGRIQNIDTKHSSKHNPFLKEQTTNMNRAETVQANTY
jgi:hypothetical protein